MFFVNSAFFVGFSVLLAFDEAAIVATHAKSTCDSNRKGVNCQKVGGVTGKKEREDVASVVANSGVESASGGKICVMSVSKQYICLW